jgi:hypothetical protein
LETIGQRALKSAYELLMTRAGKITDPALRRSFLEQVEIHRQIITRFKATSK